MTELVIIRCLGEWRAELDGLQRSYVLCSWHKKEWGGCGVVKFCEWATIDSTVDK